MTNLSFFPIHKTYKFRIINVTSERKNPTKYKIQHQKRSISRPLDNLSDYQSHTHIDKSDSEDMNFAFVIKAKAFFNPISYGLLSCWVLRGGVDSTSPDKII